jgi:hypothetical protein
MDARAEPAADLGDDIAALTSPRLDPLFWRPTRLDVDSAWMEHVPFAHWLVATAQPRVIVELGTHNGVSYSAFCEAVLRCKLPARCFAVDTWQGDAHAGDYGEEVYRALRRFHDQRYGGFSELLRCTFDAARDYVADGSIDLLHIDGMHGYDEVRHDFENWLPKLSDRAVVLFHDANVRERGFGVWQLFAELGTRYPSFEFLHQHGLGLVAVGAAAPASVRMLCALNDGAAVNAVRDRFSVLGERWRLEQQVTLFAQEVGERRHAETYLAQENKALRVRNSRLWELEGIRVRQQAQIDRLKREHAAFKGLNEQLVDLRDSQLRDREVFAQVIETLTGQRDALTAERDSLAHDRDVFTNVIQALAGERDSLARDRDVFTDVIAALTGERDSLARDREVFTNVIQALTAERDSLARDREVFTQVIDTLTGQRDAAGEHVQALTAERDSQLRDREVFTQVIATLTAQRDAATTELEDLRATLARVRRSLTWRATAPVRVVGRKLWRLTHPRRGAAS